MVEGVVVAACRPNLLSIEAGLEAGGGDDVVWVTAIRGKLLLCEPSGSCLL